MIVCVHIYSEEEESKIQDPDFDSNAAKMKMFSH